MTQGQQGHQFLKKSHFHHVSQLCIPHVLCVQNGLLLPSVLLLWERKHSQANVAKPFDDPAPSGMVKPLLICWEEWSEVLNSRVVSVCKLHFV